MINTVTNYNTPFLQRLNIKTQRRDISIFLISSFGYCMLRDIVSFCLVVTVSYFVQWLLFLYVCLLLNCVKYQLIPISIWVLFCVFNYIENKSTEWRTIVYHCHCYCFFVFGSFVYSDLECYVVNDILAICILPYIDRFFRSN